MSKLKITKVSVIDNLFESMQRQNRISVGQSIICNTCDGAIMFKAGWRNQGWQVDPHTLWQIESVSCF